jgi:hypothetical protein
MASIWLFKAVRATVRQEQQRGIHARFRTRSVPSRGRLLGRLRSAQAGGGRRRDPARRGQWELTTEVTQFAKADQGTPKIDAAVGTKETRAVCIEAADAKKPQPIVFGAEKDECTYGDFYMSSGRLSATVNCNRPGLSGNVATRADVDFKAKTLEGTLSTTTYLTTDGDVRITRKLTGRHTGQCMPQEAPKKA